MSSSHHHTPPSMILIESHRARYAESVWASPTPDEWELWCDDPVLVAQGDAYEVWADGEGREDYLLITSDGACGFFNACLDRVPGPAVVNALRAFVTADLAATVPPTAL